MMNMLRWMLVSGLLLVAATSALAQENVKKEAASTPAAGATAQTQDEDTFSQDPIEKRMQRLKPVTPQQEKEILEFLKDTHPDHYRRLVELREKEPVHYQLMLSSIESFQRRMQNTPKEVQDAMIRERNAQMTLVRLTELYNNSQTDAEKAAIRKQLREAVAEQFDAEMQRRRYRLEMMDEQIKRLTAEMAGRIAMRDQLINERVELWITNSPARFGEEERPPHGGGIPPGGPPPPPPGKDRSPSLSTQKAPE